eukprot:gene12385-20510_t
MFLGYKLYRTATDPDGAHYGSRGTQLFFQKLPGRMLSRWWGQAMELQLPESIKIRVLRTYIRLA